MTALVVDMGGITYRTSDLTPPEHHTLTVAVHEALTGLGLEPWVQVPAATFAPNLARQITDRTWRDR